MPVAAVASGSQEGLHGLLQLYLTLFQPGYPFHTLDNYGPHSSLETVHALFRTIHARHGRLMRLFQGVDVGPELSVFLPVVLELLLVIHGHNQFITLE